MFLIQGDLPAFGESTGKRPYLAANSPQAISILTLSVLGPLWSIVYVAGKGLMGYIHVLLGVASIQRYTLK